MTHQPFDLAQFLLLTIGGSLAALAVIAGLYFAVRLARNAAWTIAAAVGLSSAVAVLGAVSAFTAIVGNSTSTTDSYIAQAETLYGLTLTADDIQRLEFPADPPKPEVLFGSTVTTAEVNGAVGPTEIHLVSVTDELQLGTLLKGRDGGEPVFVELERR
ncbi:hypothetical protein [Microbacterium sp. 77mftsu3.1]|uniref:hypothetical protein n=1 Tax=Microbacterium sp. 77mftsu3.1 TaxID=1761802 RepID=UPI0003A9081C|nr:hypothetical protein [Microbacterium sp. 77mftsu3.1]SDH41736.1 hypothetical protein SAMN04488590_3288 [Microbacterium sp. 77mftsu3.1]